jgi:hypothetical protein
VELTVDGIFSVIAKALAPLTVLFVVSLKPYVSLFDIQWIVSNFTTE